MTRENPETTHTHYLHDIYGQILYLSQLASPNRYMLNVTLGCIQEAAGKPPSQPHSLMEPRGLSRNIHQAAPRDEKLQTRQLPPPNPAGGRKTRCKIQ